MSLAIDPAKVVAVLLPDGWHNITLGSFEIDSYEYVDYGDGDFRILHGGGESDICASGFEFKQPGQGGRARTICGPLTAILAVQVGGPPVYVEGDLI